MLMISHRGNICGPDKEIENNPNHINNLLKNKINVEIDVWFLNKNFYLGHDNPKYLINHSFLMQKNLWCHAKNLTALSKMLEMNIICFWHQEDDFTLTSNNIIWTYPNKITCKKSIIVDTSNVWKEKKYNCFGVCVDYLN